MIGQSDDFGFGFSTLNSVKQFKFKFIQCSSILDLTIVAGSNSLFFSNNERDTKRVYKICYICTLILHRVIYKCIVGPASGFEILLNFLNTIIDLIIHMKKLLDSDWLRAVQFKCNTSAKSVTPVQKV